jgi:hypothetical protein
MDHKLGASLGEDSHKGNLYLKFLLAIFLSYRMMRYDEKNNIYSTLYICVVEMFSSILIEMMNSCSVLCSNYV